MKTKKATKEVECMTLEELCEKYDIEIEVTQYEKRGERGSAFRARISRGASVEEERRVYSKEWFGLFPASEGELPMSEKFPLECGRGKSRDEALSDLSGLLSYINIVLDKDGTEVTLPKIIHIP